MNGIRVEYRLRGYDSTSEHDWTVWTPAPDTLRFAFPVEVQFRVKDDFR